MGVIKSLLDNDLYKFTMMQMAFRQFPSVRVKYEFVNRNKLINLTPLANKIKEEILSVCELRFKEDEILYLESLNWFKKDYLSYLKDFKLNPSDVTVGEKDNKLTIEINGLWVETILWEIYLLSIVNEVYFKENHPNALNSLNPYERLLKKVNLVKELNQSEKDPGFKFSEFGTRRRYSREWQERVYFILKTELPLNCIGTSNVYLSMKTKTVPIGTAAHEAYAAQQAIAGINRAHTAMFDSWLKEYNGELSILLTDIYTTEAFLKDFTKEYAEELVGLRHDSGDPYLWFNKVVSHYKKLGIDPKSKKLVFSDGLNFKKAIELYQHTKEIAPSFYGIGTDLTNDFEHKALNVVIKMTECNGVPVVKISDEPTKAIGNSEKIFEIKRLYNI